jgi:serine/threonine protein kinase
MGEVYRARDRQLNRNVALKILPDAFVSDPERLAPIGREAQVLASLNHPNIAQIFSVETSGPVRAIVMELVEGQTLAERIAKGPLPVDEALTVAKQIAEALEAAHEQGIIHRDLKPANIKIRDDGTVKVLDFGLAKLTEADGAQPARPQNQLTNSPTITSPAVVTSVGVLLGTAAYMSPEQVKGRPADKRSDIWAFGCVFYEMITGGRAFDGEDVTDTLAAILTRSPRWDVLRATIPVSVRRLLHRCLERDRRRRFADIGDVRLDLDDALVTPLSGTSRPPRGRYWRFALAGVALLIIGAAGAGLVVRSSRFAQNVQSPDRVLRFSVIPPPGGLFIGGVAISPDERVVAAAVMSRSNRMQIWTRALDGLAFQPLTGTENGAYPFWSPDGRWIGFSTARGLKKYRRRVASPSPFVTPHQGMWWPRGTATEPSCTPIGICFFASRRVVASRFRSAFIRRPTSHTVPFSRCCQTVVISCTCRQKFWAPMPQPSTSPRLILEW